MTQSKIDAVTDQDQPVVTFAPLVPSAQRPRAGKGRFVASLDTAERDAEAARLRTRGQTLRQIAAQMGYADPSGVSRAIKRAFDAARREAGAEALALAHARLDAMQAAVVDVLERNHYAVSAKGNIVYKGEEALRDDSVILGAIDRMLKIEERRARLDGYDAPAKVRMEVRGVSQLDATISDLLSDMDARDAASRAGTDQDRVVG